MPELCPIAPETASVCVCIYIYVLGAYHVTASRQEGEFTIEGVEFVKILLYSRTKLCLQNKT
jgi:hypothetical protein